VTNIDEILRFVTTKKPRKPKIANLKFESFTLKLWPKLIHKIDSRKEIANTYLSGVSSSSDEFCFLCSSQPGGKNKELKKYRYLSLLVHLGSKHNCILDFAGPDLLQQLQGFNVYKQ
jgi:hypothetical protein